MNVATESQKQEAAIAARLRALGLKASTTPGSGNQATAPNDVVVTNRFHIECKTTEGIALAFHHAWIQRAQQLAKQFRVPAFIAIRFSRFSQTDYFVIEDRHFYSFLAAEDQNEQLLRENRALREELALIKRHNEKQGPYPNVDPYAAARKKL